MNTNRWMWNNRNIQNNTSAGTVLQAIKGETTAGLLSNNLSRFADVRWPPTTPGLVFSVRKQFNRRHNASSDCCRFRTSPQEGLHNRTTSPTLSCSCFVVDSHDHLEFLQTWLSAAGTITFKLFDAPLHEFSAAIHYLCLCRPKITSI